MGQAVHHPLADWSALTSFRPPDPMIGQEGVDLMETEVDADKHRHFVIADGGEVFQRMIFLRGMEPLMLDLYEEREELLILRDQIVEVCLRRIERWGATNKVDAIMLRDDWGTQQALMIAPELWRRIFLPAYQTLVDAIHATGAYVSFHSDGVIHQILPDLVDIGCDEINPQTNVMDIEALGERFSGKVCVRADIDRQYALPHGTPEEVSQLVRRLHVAFGTQSGGYVGWGEMSSDVPLANGRAVLETCCALTYDSAGA